MSQAPRSLLTAEEIREAARVFSHPWNERSRVIGTHLSALTGLQRAGVSLVRIPAGRESFCYHRHHREEEWVYVLAGYGTAEIGESEHAIGPGDFLAFPAGGEAHHLRNTGSEDLVYLMGGENHEHEIADFPRQGKRMVRLGESIEIFDLEDAEPFPLEPPSKSG
jgi:uncharacterized cupin superfamily protein